MLDQAAISQQRKSTRAYDLTNFHADDAAAAAVAVGGFGKGMIGEPGGVVQAL